MLDASWADLRTDFRLLQSESLRWERVNAAQPDLVLIGGIGSVRRAALEQLYKNTIESPRIARMSIVSAELTKISVNSYITMKVSLPSIADDRRTASPGRHSCHPGRIGSDSRIGKKYLRSV